MQATTLQAKFGFQDADLSTPAHDALMVWLDQNVESYLLSLYGPSYLPPKVTGDLIYQMKDRVNALICKLSNAAQEYEVDDPGLRSWEKSARDRQRQSIAGDLEKARKWEIPQPPSEIWIKIDTSNAGYSVKSFLPDRFRVAKKVWEFPIMTGRDFMVGFVDMAVMAEVVDGLSYDNQKDPEQLPGELSAYGTAYEYLFEVKPSIQSVGELIRQIRMYQQYKAGRYVVVSPDDRFASTLNGQGIGFLKAPAQ